MAEKPFHWPGRRTSDPGHEMVAAFLVMDIQRNPQWAREVAERIEQIKSGSLSEWERIGNAYRLELTTTSALIEDLVDEDTPAQTVALEEFAVAVDAWMEAFS